MNEALEKYFQIGVVAYMARPALGYAETSLADYQEWIKKFAEDSFFSVLELNPVSTPEQEQILSKISRESALKLKYGAQGLILQSGLNPNSLDESERKKAVALLCEKGVAQAFRLGADGVAFLSGHWSNEEREKQLNQLAQSCIELCRFADQKGIFVELEAFDYDLDKCVLIGPAPLALRLAESVRKECQNFGLMVDLSHFPQTREASRDVIASLRPYITHFHIGNAVVEPGCEAFGDQHPRFGFPHSCNDVPQLLEFLRCLRDFGFFKADHPYVLSFEVRPGADEDPDLVLAGAKRSLLRAWSLL